MQSFGAAKNCTLCQLATPGVRPGAYAKAGHYGPIALLAELGVRRNFAN